jgi:alpha-D-xyloside xylohydrolase
MRRALASTALLTLAGCSDDPLPATGILETGDFRLVLDDRPELRLERRGEALLTFDAAAFSLGLVGAVSDDVNYDPYRLWVPYPLYAPIEDLAFVTPESATFVATTEADLALALTYPEGVSAILSARALADGRFGLRLTPAPADRVAFVRLAPRAAPDEGFYGLGELFDDVNQRGKVRAMQLEVDGGVESTNNEAHVPVPLLVGTRGWGMFVESRRPGAFAVAVADASLVEAAFGTGVASGEGLPFHLFAAEHPLDVTRHYYDTTGFPKLPARGALGPWIWRDESEDQAEVEADLDAIRDLDLATTGYWIDRPYATAVNSFDFEAARFPDAAAMFDKLGDLGFLSALWHTPYLDEGDPATAALVAEAEAAGLYPLEVGVSLNGWGRPLDFTKSETVSFWQGLLAPYRDLGVQGFKLDYGEDVVAGIFRHRTPWRFADGQNEQTMHAGYPLAYHATYAALFDGGAFLLCRGGSYGDQRHGIIIWPGDLDASFTKHRQASEHDGERYVSVGGLPASIVAGLTLGPSGFPFYGADTGGYRHAPPDRELFSRWFEQTALSTVMQVGMGSSDVPWEFTPENGFDQAMLDSYRDYARLHLRLFPYLYSHAQRLLADGRPIQRAFGLAYPELGMHPNDVYLLGDDLLVAPVVERGVARRSVPLPPGRWVDWWSGEAFEGPATIDVDAPLGRLPLFLRAGGLVPLLRPTIDTLEPTSEPARVDSYATRPGLIYVRSVAGHVGSFTLFDGGVVEQRLAPEGVTLAFRAGAELAEGAVFELLVASRPSAVTRDGAPLAEQPTLAALEAGGDGWFHDGSVLWVKMAPGDVGIAP